MVTGILDGMRWLGLDWDEAPTSAARTRRTSRPSGSTVIARRPRGCSHAGQAYCCYCRPSDLQAERAEAEAAGEALELRPRAACRCARRRLPRARGRRQAARRPVPRAGRPDDVRRSGARPIDVRARANIEDFVILRSDGHPTYHLSVVVDDVDMAITHVVRGDDHISNTPKQVLLYQALGAPVPAFAHVPLILGPDKKRLSKRHGATSVGEYQAQGYLPEAMVNFLALLGWSPRRRSAKCSRATS